MTQQSSTWLKTHNIVSIAVSIITTIVLLIGTFSALLVRLSILETKMDLVLANQKEVTATIIKQEAADVAMVIRLTALETANNLKK